MEEQELLTLIDENGNEVLYQVVLTFDSEDYNKSYVLLAPLEEPGDEEDIEVFAYSYTEQEDGSIGDLVAVETDEEWDMIEEVLETEFEMDDHDHEHCDHDHHHHD